MGIWDFIFFLLSIVLVFEKGIFDVFLLIKEFCLFFYYWRIEYLFNRLFLIFDFISICYKLFYKVVLVVGIGWEESLIGKGFIE